MTDQTKETSEQLAGKRCDVETIFKQLENYGNEVKFFEEGSVKKAMEEHLFHQALVNAVYNRPENDKLTVAELRKAMDIVFGKNNVRPSLPNQGSWVL